MIKHFYYLARRNEENWSTLDYETERPNMSEFEDLKRSLGARVTKKSGADTEVFNIRGRKSTKIGTRITKKNGPSTNSNIQVATNALQSGKRFKIRVTKKGSFGARVTKKADFGARITRKPDFGARVTRNTNFGARVTKKASDDFVARGTKGWQTGKENNLAMTIKKFRAATRITKRPRFGIRVTKKSNSGNQHKNLSNLGARLAREYSLSHCLDIIYGKKDEEVDVSTLRECNEHPIDLVLELLNTASPEVDIAEYLTGNKIPSHHAIPNNGYHAYDQSTYGEY